MNRLIYDICSVRYLIINRAMRTYYSIVYVFLVMETFETNGVQPQIMFKKCVEFEHVFEEGSMY